MGEGAAPVNAASRDNGADIGVDLRAPNPSEIHFGTRLKITLGLSARSEALLVGSTSRAGEKDEQLVAGLHPDHLAEQGLSNYQLRSFVEFATW